MGEDPYDEDYFDDPNLEDDVIRIGELSAKLIAISCTDECCKS